MPTPVPEVSTLPPAPVRGQAGFSAATGTFLEALPDWGDQIDAAGASIYQNAVEVFEAMEDASALALAAQVAISSTDYATTSSTNLTVGSGAKTFVIDDPDFIPGVDVDLVLISQSDAETKLAGQITARTGTSITIAVPADGYTGTGPKDDWFVMSAVFGAQGATAADVLAGISSLLALTPKAMKDAMAPVVLPFNATLIPDLSAGRYFTVDAPSSFTLNPAVNAWPGAFFILDITNTAGSIVLATSSVYKRQQGLFKLSPTNGHRNLIGVVVRSVNGSDVVTDAVYNGQRNPTTS